MINVLVIHYNTPYLTECLVNSINMFVKDPVIYIFDNSDKNPFTAKFDNVKILDNTKGQYINFDEWLENYPNKRRSRERTHSFGSAKHCYSVEKCMEIINDNFILLDSDVLLKKDISDLYDDNVIYTGEIITQPLSNIKRVLPYVCFINTKKCKENNVHYFNDDYMHGLYKTIKSDRYDTGAGFFIEAHNFQHKEIKSDEYIIHYKAGSWDNNAKKLSNYTQKLSIDEWIKKYKKYWSNEKNKKVIYTCITGGYDSLMEPTFVTNDFDYICFTDNTDLKSDVWEIRHLPSETEEFTNVKKQRYVKINPHRLLEEYDLSIWVDGNVEIKGDLNDFLEKNTKNENIICVPTHPQRKCIYDEEKAVISLKKDIKENTHPQIERYENEGFPKGYGLLQSNILVRKHNNPDCIKLMEDWFEEVKNGSHRDQLSFNYVSWKNENIKVAYIDKFIYKSQWFKWHAGHKKVKKDLKTNGIKTYKERIEEVRRRKNKITTQNIRIYRI